VQSAASLAREVGARLGWMKPGLEDSAWRDIKTTAFWENQGHREYNGAAWYRLTFRVPAERKGANAKIRFGAIDESWKLWINGRKVDEYFFDADKNPDSWKQPVTVDVSEYLRAGEANTVALKVIDLSGMGGLWRPAYLIWEDDPRDLMENGGFKSGLRFWSLSGKGEREFEVLPEAGRDGGPCFHARVEQHGAYLSLTQRVNGVEAGKTYLLTVRAKCAGTEPNPEAPHLKAVHGRVIYKDKRGRSVTDTKGYLWFSMRGEALKDWREFHQAFTARPKTEKIALTLFFHRRGEYWVDRVRLTPAEQPEG
jgi:hypothetical protein